MIFATFAAYLQELEHTSSRLDMTAILARLFKELPTEEIGQAIYLIQGRIAPLFAAPEFGLSDKLVMRAVVQMLGDHGAHIVDKAREMGDLGDAYEQIVDTPGEHIPLPEVFLLLKNLTSTTGSGSVEKKLLIVSDLLKKLSGQEAKYIIRMLTGTMRLGASDVTFMDALSWMLTGGKTLRKDIEKAYQVNPDLGELAEIIKKEGVVGLSAVKPQLGTPIMMMRAERASSAEEILEKSPEVLIEDKYDGFRLQIHYDATAGTMQFFSRGQESMTHMFPDIAADLPKLAVNSIIFEGEAVGFNPETGAMLPFQETVQRKRKHDILAVADKVPVKLFIFDLLYLNNEPVLYKPLSERRALLEQIFSQGHGTLVLPEAEYTKSPTRIMELFTRAQERGQEGIMAKKPGSAYTPGARDAAWMKLKLSYDSSVADTIDVVVMGYDTGKGKRTGFGIGAFLVGVWNGLSEQYETVAKIGTGLTDEEWKTLFELCQPLKTPTIPSNYTIDKLVACDVYVRPEIVVEIRADEITRSPMHTAGRVVEDNGLGSEIVIADGLALRFPRLERFRPDKKPMETTTVEELRKLAKV